MLIRKVEPGDGEHVGDVDVEAFMNSGWGDAHNMRQDQELQRERREQAKQYCEGHPDWVFVAVENDNVVGFATLEYDAGDSDGARAK